jgi:hypothetical protein
MTKLPAPNIDARYVITLADLQQLKKAQLIAGLALEPKTGYKPASRDIMVTALKCCVDVIDKLELDDYVAGESDGTGADPQNQTDSLKPEPTGFNSLPGLSGSSQTVVHSILTETPDVH